MLGNRLNVLEIGQTLLEGVVQHWTARTDPAVEPLPDRRYLYGGDAAVVPWDCEQFTVAMQGIGNGQGEDASATAPPLGAGTSVFNVRHVIFEILVLRCVAVVDDEGNAPPVSVMHAEGERAFRDAGMLSQALTEIAASVRPQLEKGGIARAGQVLAVGPEGGFGGVVGLFQVSLLGLQ